jgi:hypothetical protein
MQRNGSRDTTPEVAVRSALQRAAIYKHRWPIAGPRCESDILFPEHTRPLDRFVVCPVSASG